MRLGQRTHRALKLTGYVSWALLLFVLFLYQTLPLHRVQALVEGQTFVLGEWSVEVAAIGGMSARPPFALRVEGLKLRVHQLPGRARRAGYGGATNALLAPAAPTAAAGPRTQLVVIDELGVALGLSTVRAVLQRSTVAGLLAQADVDVTLRGLGGSAELSYRATPREGARLRLEAEGIDASQVPQLQSLGPPVSGRLGAAIDLRAPGGRWAEAAGSIDLQCNGLAMGDGKAKLIVPSNPLLALGLTFPRLRLGRLSGRVRVEKGLVQLGSLSLRSPDLELRVDGTIQLRDPLLFSVVEAFAQFRIGADLMRRESTLFAPLDLALGAARRPDGFFGLRISGALRAPLVIPSQQPARGA
ncbi:MAG: type II secretion system protein GspN [Proteobacteria bacterium]|nr:type II secretion system protein GspN [Pseudomonadota bacterium]